MGKPESFCLISSKNGFLTLLQPPLKVFVFVGYAAASAGEVQPKVDQKSSTESVQLTKYITHQPVPRRLSCS